MAPRERVEGNMFGEALSCLRRIARPAAAGALVAFVLWLILAMTGALLSYATDYGLAAGWVVTALSLGGLLVSAAQVAIVVLFMAGLLRLSLRGPSAGRPAAPSGGRSASLRELVCPAGSAAWLLLAAALAALPVVVVVAVVRSADVTLAQPEPLQSIAELFRNAADTNAIGVLWPAAALLAIPLYAAFVFTAPLIVDRRLNAFTAAAGSLRLAFGRMHLRDLPVAFAGTLGLTALCTPAVWRIPVVWDGSTGSQPWDQHTPAIVWVVVHFPWPQAAAGAAALAMACACVVSVLAVFYRRFREAERLESAPVSALARTPRSTLAGLVVVAVTAACLSLTLSWTAGDGASRGLAGGQRVSLANGLSLVVPRAWKAETSTYRRYPAWLPVGQNTGGPASHPGLGTRIGGLADMAWFEQSDGMRAPHAVVFSCFSGDAYALANANHSPLAWAAPDGSVTVRGKMKDGKLTDNWPYVVTRLPDHMIGVVWIWLPRDKNNRPQATLGDIWNELSVQGVSLPAAFH